MFYDHGRIPVFHGGSETKRFCVFTNGIKGNIGELGSNGILYGGNTVFCEYGFNLLGNCQ